jgi:mRNA interferase HicA
MKCNELIRVLERDGWYLVRQNGSHMIMKHPIKKGLVVMLDHGSKEIGKGLERSIRKDAGLQ